MLHPLLNPRKGSPLRGTLLVLASTVAAFLIADFPRNRATLFLALPALFAVVGTVDTVRCMQRRWSLYHAGVVLLIYMDLMALFMIFFLFLYPYAHWFSESR